MTDDRQDGSGVRVSRRRALTIGGAAAASLLTARYGSTGTDSADRAKRAPNRSGGDPIRRVRRAGVTGAHARVAVLDPTGFDPTQPTLAGAVTDIRQFGAERAAVDETTHGTAAAASVARLAPDADLLLASFRTPAEFAAAIDWCHGRAVDVVLAPVAAHGTVATPRSEVYRAARRAVDAGCAFVAPTGNAALGHWQGPAAALVGDGPESRRRLRVGARPGAASVAGRLRAWLAPDPSLDLDLTLALLRAVDGGRRWNLVAVSRSTERRAGQRLVADLTDDEYALVVRSTGSPSPTGPTGPASPDTGAGRVEVTTPTHTLSPARPLGSIAAPASVPGVVGVGVTPRDRADGESRANSSSRADTSSPANSSARANSSSPANSPARANSSSRTDASDATLADPVSPYSGRGPTPTGGVGVDVVAPPHPWVADGRAGTSAAAARVAGVAALLRSVDRTLTPAEVTRVLRRSAGDVGRPGRDLASGWGRLDIVAAVQRVRSR